MWNNKELEENYAPSIFKGEFLLSGGWVYYYLEMLVGGLFFKELQKNCPLISYCQIG